VTLGIPDGAETGYGYILAVSRGGACRGRPLPAIHEKPTDDGGAIVAEAATTEQRDLLWPAATLLKAVAR